MTADGPQVSVVLCAYNRAERIESVVRAVLNQRNCEFELLVVDDGSTDPTPKVLASIEDERLRVLRRPNGGLSAARNTGLKEATGRWTVFLDDDDLPEEGWLATLARSMSHPGVAVTCCGATEVDPDGREISAVDPTPLGELFGDVVGLFLAGCFAARTDLLRRAGGYLEGLGTSHQLELCIRLLAVARTEGLIVVSESARRLRIERRDITARPQRNPRRLYDGARWKLARHPEAFARAPATLASFEAIAGVNGARLGEWKAARRHLLRSTRARPTSLRQWGRLALATVPPVGRRVWARHGDFASRDAGEIGVRRQAVDDTDTGDPELFLAWRYQENPARTERDWQSVIPVQRLGIRLARKYGWHPVLDLCEVDGDLNDRTIWNSLSDDCPGLVICANLIERIDEPIRLLHRLARLSAGRPVLLSTPDRAVVDSDRPLGPPHNPHHRREWTRDQFELLLLSTGFAIEQRWFVPPRGHLLLRPVQRALEHEGLARAREVMVFLVRARLP